MTDTVEEFVQEISEEALDFIGFLLRGGEDNPGDSNGARAFCTTAYLSDLYIEI